MSAQTSEPTRCEWCGQQMSLHYDQSPLHDAYPPLGEPHMIYLCVNPDCHLSDEDGDES
jgi:hypothetical protein